MVPTTLFSVAILAISGVLIFWHVRFWRLAQQEQLDERHREHFFRQYRRRMQSSTMIGLVGVAVFAGQWLTKPFWVAIYYGVVVLIVGWTCLLAVADVVNTRMFFRRIRDEHVVEQARLQAEIDRAERHRHNGDD